MKTILASLALVGTTLSASPALARHDVAIGQEARIPFVSFNSIRNFRALDQDTLYVQDQRRRWYRAEVIGPCFNLPFAHAIGFETRGTNSLDRFSTVLVEGDRCQLTSLVRSEAPPKKRRGRRS